MNFNLGYWFEPGFGKLTINPFVIGTRMLKTKMRAFSFVVHLIGELGEHKTLPTLEMQQTMKIPLDYPSVL